MDRILTEGRTVIRSDTQRELEGLSNPRSGVTRWTLNFRAARRGRRWPRRAVPRIENERYIREAEAYTSEDSATRQQRSGAAYFWKEDAYETQLSREARRGKVARFAKGTPEYKEIHRAADYARASV